VYNRVGKKERKVRGKIVDCRTKKNMAKTKKLEEILSVSGEAAKIVSYADYFSRRPLFSSLQIKNTGEEAVNDLILSVTNENAMLIPCEKSLEEIPYESVVEVDLGNILSPHFFAGLERYASSMASNKGCWELLCLLYVVHVRCLWF